MPYVLRKIKRIRWESKCEWLQPDEVQADALSDLNTQNNELSVWLIFDDQSNIRDVVAALSLSGDYIPVVDYALIALDVVVANGFEVAENMGVTPFTAANQWHRDLVRLSATKILQLSKIVNQAAKARCREKESLRYIAGALELRES